MRNIAGLLLFMGIILLSGCATFVAPDYSPNYEAVDRLKKINAEHFNVATVEPTMPTAKVNNISLRGASLKSSQGTFAKYIEYALISDLTEMGLYDASSVSRIEVVLLKNDIDISGFSVGIGALEANIKIIRKGGIVLDKNYSVSTQFESSFAGAVAIPKGQSEYPNLVRSFLKQVYMDAAFIEAIKK